jgi:calcium/calmodulin-dependent 3',5'-cyclic nucleotide phosphodiesterase
MDIRLCNFFCFVSFRRTGFEADDEDDELSKVEADAVPTEVRDWLAQTFTRSTAAGSATKRSAGDNKPKFRSVANAIRAGILVDR